MAIKYYEKYPRRWESPSQDYPQGAFKNLSALGEQDGSYLEKDWLNDYSGFFGALLRNAEMTPNGLVDTAQRSQFYDALIKVAKESVLGDILVEGEGNSTTKAMTQKSVTDALNKKWDIQVTTGTGNIARMSEVTEKADTSYVNTELVKKRDKTDVTFDTYLRVQTDHPHSFIQFGDSERAGWLEYDQRDGSFNIQGGRGYDGTSNYRAVFPTKSGTIALTSDIPAVDYGRTCALGGEQQVRLTSTTSYLEVLKLVPVNSVVTRIAVDMTDYYMCYRPIIRAGW